MNFTHGIFDVGLQRLFKLINGNDRLFVGILQSNVVLLQICESGGFKGELFVSKNNRLAGFLVYFYKRLEGVIRTSYLHMRTIKLESSVKR